MYTPGMAKKTRGRPPKRPQDRREERLDLRVAAEEKTVFREAAEASGVQLSVWIRRHLHEAARKELA